MCALALNLLSDSTLGSPFTSFRRFDFATALATKLHFLFERVMNSPFSLCQVIKSSPFFSIQTLYDWHHYIARLFGGGKNKKQNKQTNPHKKCL